MARAEQHAALAPPAVVAQQLGELLMAFPSAASEGVAWRVLARKFEERHKARLDLHALGHSSQLAAATTLLWDVLRLVETTDENDIVVGIEDAIALTPRPGALGSWPSLYKSLCDIVCEHGSAGDAAPGARSSTLLLSQIRPLIERHWHAGFDESGLGFMNEDGSFVRLKKLKHLLHAVLRWRDQHQAWRRRCPATKTSAIDKALAPCLRLVASEKHNDLLLQCIVGGEPGAEPAQSTDADRAVKGRSQRPKPSGDLRARTASEQGSEQAELDQLQRELERLRCENSSLRVENMALQQKGLADLPPGQWSSSASSCTRESIPQLCSEIFDDPFEPPPEEFWSSRKASDYSLETGSTISYASSAISSTPQAQSGAMTPMQPMAPQQPCTFVPMWFFPTAFAGVDVSVIPRGIVETARAHFESLGAK